MERLEYDTYGGPEVMRLGAFTLPQPQAEEVLVRVAAASINPMDWKIRNGDMKVMTGFGFPRAMGTDFAGTVEAVGSKVSRIVPGDAVVGTVSMKRSGAFAPMLITTQDLVVKKPANLSFGEAACLPIAGGTAWHALVKSARLERGQKVFINGASGAVGQAAVAIAHDLGAQVVGRGGPQSQQQMQAMGLHLVLDYTQTLSPSLDGSFDVVFDAHGGLSVGEGDRLVKRGGTIIDIAPTTTKFLKALVSRSRKIVFADVKADNLQHVVRLAAARKLVIPPVRTISLDQAPLLLASLEQGHRLNGKAIISF